MAGVRNIYSMMHPSVGLTPEKLIAIQREAEAGDPYLYLELAEEMEEKDLHYLAVIGTRKQAVAGAELIVTPASEAAEDLRAADLVRDFVGGGAFDLESALYDILDAVGKGFSATEIIWDTAGREWIPKRLMWRDPRWFMFDWISGEELLVRTLRDEGPLAPADAAPVAPAQTVPPAPRRAIASRGSAGTRGAAATRVSGSSRSRRRLRRTSLSCTSQRPRPDCRCAAESRAPRDGPISSRITCSRTG